jgi:heme oxygenase
LNSDTTFSSFTSREPRLLETPIGTSDPAAFLAHLKMQTRSEHDAIERVLSLTSGRLTLAGYCEQLALFYGFYKPLETRLHDGMLSSAAPPDALCRRKTAWLANDLEALGFDVRELALCNRLPALETAADRLGCFYVLEGATLGGQIISRHLRQTLGVTPEQGGRFFHAYGASTAFMWQSFRGALCAFATTADTQQAVIDSAVSTFRAMRRWCEGGLA